MVDADNAEFVAMGKNVAIVLAAGVGKRMQAKTAKQYIELEGKVDSIVFTAGVLENGSEMRQMIVDRLAPLGITLNTEMNDKIAGFKEIHEGIITDPYSKINIMVLPTNEEIMIVKDAFNLIINK